MGLSLVLVLLATQGEPPPTLLDQVLVLESAVLTPSLRVSYLLYIMHYQHTLWEVSASYMLEEDTPSNTMLWVRGVLTLNQLSRTMATPTPWSITWSLVLLMASTRLILELHHPSNMCQEYMPGGNKMHSLP